VHLPMKRVAIIGAGLAGLECARQLQRAGLNVFLLEASDAAGGRVRTDNVDGYLLDRGFQVLLTAYPEARRALDYNDLHLCTFLPGALVWHGGRFHRFADPFREPVAAMTLLFDPVISILDKLNIVRLRRHVCRMKNDECFEQPESTTRAFLKNFGFSEKILRRFFVPFLGGVFLEDDLVTSSRYFQFLFKMFSIGSVCIPSHGMEEIPKQLAASLDPNTLVLGARVKTLKRSKGRFALEVEGAALIEADTVVVATDGPEAKRLLAQAGGSLEKPGAQKWNSTTTFYYSADQRPVGEAILVLNGEGQSAGPVNHLVVMSAVSRSYAPMGFHLLSVSVVGEAPDNDRDIAKLESKVREHLVDWFGGQVREWRLLGGFPIRCAVPQLKSAVWEKSALWAQLADSKDPLNRVYLCGDHRETSSLQGALTSGRRVAEAILQEFGK
jgi:phytoene dehydrogenase-like protein